VFLTDKKLTITHKRALTHYLDVFRHERHTNHKAITFDLVSHILRQLAIVKCRASLASQDISSGISGFDEHCLALALASLPIYTLSDASVQGSDPNWLR
jgi:hypothetical protein